MTAQTLGDLVKLFEAEGRAALVRALAGAPALVVRVGLRDPDASTVNTVTFSLAETHEGDAMGAWAGATASSQVVRVAKSERNPFSALITVGRAGNNDICLPSQRVSKLHAFLKQAPGRGWLLLDNGSANGTFLNTIRLESNRDHALRSGDELQFADVSATFLDGDGMHTLCTLVSRHRG